MVQWGFTPHSGLSCCCRATFGVYPKYDRLNDFGNHPFSTSIFLWSHVFLEYKYKIILEFLSLLHSNSDRFYVVHFLELLVLYVNGSHPVLWELSSPQIAFLLIGVQVLGFESRQLFKDEEQWDLKKVLVKLEGRSPCKQFLKLNYASYALTSNYGLLCIIMETIMNNSSWRLSRIICPC